MRISVVIIVSLAVNLILAALLFKKSAGGAAGKTGASEAGSSSVAAGHPAVVPLENSVTTPAGRVSWRDLQAADLKEFIRKLRAVNCPEGTIQDLVLAELNRRFTAKQSAIWKDTWSEQKNYWKPYQRKQDLEKVKKNRENSRQMQAAQKEKTALIVELFGFDVEKQRMKEEGYDAENMGWNPAGNLSFLPEAKRAAVEKYLTDFNEKEQELYASIAGSWGPEERAKQKQLAEEKLAGLAQFLTPEEVREYALRNSQTAQQISSDLHGTDISRQQYEALFDIREKYGDSIYNYGDANNTPEQIKQIEQNKKDMMADVGAALGTDKAAELERAQDYQYLQLVSLAKRNDLPADTAPKIYDYKQSAEKAAEDLKANQDLTPEQRQAALLQIRTETETSIKSALGDKPFKRYMGNGGWWLNNLAPAQSK